MSGIEPIKILVIDDDEMALVIARKILEAEQFTVECCPSAQEALSRLAKNRYNAIFCDIWMPGMSGQEFYQQLKTDFPEYRSRIIFVTGDMASEATWDFIEERRLPYLIKPFHIPELRKKLREVIGEGAVSSPPSPKKDIENRRHRRIPIKASVRVRKKRWDTAGPDISVVTNFSKEGVYFVTDRSYRVGTEVLISFPYMGPNDPEQEGYVVRAEERTGGKFGVAVALGEAVEAARAVHPGIEEDRKRQRILAMADMSRSAPTGGSIAGEVADAAALRAEIDRERQDARRLAEELADLKSTYEHVAAQRERLSEEEASLKKQLNELISTREAMGQAVEDLHQQMETLQKELAVGEEFRFKATHDALTGLWNRPAILDMLRRELQRARREGFVIGVVLADLDHFKHVNDTFGHLGGDAVLQEAARRMSSSVRTYDAVGRYGGEEFLIVLPGCDTTTAFNQAERIRTGLASEPVQTPEGTIPITVSLGVAAGNREEEVESLLRAADAALYRAKRAGRNRTELGNPGESPSDIPASPEQRKQEAGGPQGQSVGSGSGATS